MSRRIKPTRPGPERGRPRQVTQPSVEWLPSRKRGAEDDSAVRIRASVRVAWVGAIIAVGYLLLVGRASSLMLLPDPQLEAKARIQFEEAVEVHGRRGDIVDRNHTLLATTVDLYELHVDPWFLHRVPGAEVARVMTPFSCWPTSSPRSSTSTPRISPSASGVRGAATSGWPRSSPRRSSSASKRA
jgi:hypothetical protein